ncbi:hypothetical protein [Pararhizobium sp. PWRC1-1]|uniref:hypothetical protein n=1 Tax=Pararhizobium sp. PWRC1-1 TaxID=2804566 RepID=UPI003CE6EF0D
MARICNAEIISAHWNRVARLEPTQTLGVAPYCGFVCGCFPDAGTTISSTSHTCATSASVADAPVAAVHLFDATGQAMLGRRSGPAYGFLGQELRVR